jgi:acyl carrier protein
MTETVETVTQTLITVLKEFTQDWDLDLGEILPETRLSADLCFTSIDMINLMATVDVRFDKRLPYDRLIMQDGRYRSELTISEFADFVHANLATPRPGPSAM